MFGCKNNDRLFPEKYTVEGHTSNNKLEKGDHYYIQTAGTVAAFMDRNSSNLESSSISPSKAACYFLSSSRHFWNSSSCSFLRFRHNFLWFSSWACNWLRQALPLFWGVLDDWLLLVEGLNTLVMSTSSSESLRFLFSLSKLSWALCFENTRLSKHIYPPFLTNPSLPTHPLGYNQLQNSPSKELSNTTL